MNHLPQDILGHIASFCDLQSQQRLRLVNKEWKHVIESKGIFLNPTGYLYNAGKELLDLGPRAYGGSIVWCSLWFEKNARMIFNHQQHGDLDLLAALLVEQEIALTIATAVSTTSLVPRWGLRHNNLIPGATCLPLLEHSSSVTASENLRADIYQQYYYSYIFVDITPVGGVSLFVENDACSHSISSKVVERIYNHIMDVRNPGGRNLGLWKAILRYIVRTFNPHNRFLQAIEWCLQNRYNSQRHLRDRWLKN